MQQDIPQNQFSFIQNPPENTPVQTSNLEQSAIFGQGDKETIFESTIQYSPATPQQYLTELLESLGSILARCLALQIIGIQSSLQQAAEYLNNNVQDMKMAIYNAQIMFNQKQQSQEFNIARDEQCKQIQQIINQLDDENVKQTLSKLLGSIEEVRFASQYKLKITPSELLETQAIYFQVIQKDPSTKTFVDLVKKDSIKIAQQLSPHIIVMSAVFKEILKLDIIHQNQQNTFSQQKFLNHIQSLSKDQEISSYCQQISKIYPQMKDHFQEIEEMRNRQRNDFETQLTEDDIEILQLFYDRQSTYVQQISEKQYFPEQICELIQLTCFLITEESKEDTCQKIQSQIQATLQSESFKQYSFIFDLIAETIHSSKLKLLFYGYVECTLDAKFTRFTHYLQTDLITLNQLSKTCLANFNQEDLQYLKQMLCITKRQNIQYENFNEIIKCAGEFEVLLATQQKEIIMEEANELENIIFESLELNELIINKEPDALLLRMKKLKFYLELLLSYYKVSNDTLSKLFLYYNQIYENKQQSAIFQKQKVQNQKEQYSAVQNQKRSQNYMETMNQILNADSQGTEKFIYKPSIYKIFKGLSNSSGSQSSLKKILIKFQALYQNTYANEIQSDFVNLLKEIKSYSKDKQAVFEANFRKYYKNEFKNQLMELPHKQFESLAYTLKLVQSIENQPQLNL